MIYDRKNKWKLCGCMHALRKTPILVIGLSTCLQLKSVVEINNYNSNFFALETFFSTTHQKSWQVQLKNDIIIENNKYMSTPWQ